MSGMRLSPLARVLRHLVLLTGTVAMLGAVRAVCC